MFTPVECQHLYLSSYLYSTTTSANILHHFLRKFLLKNNSLTHCFQENILMFSMAASSRCKISLNTCARLLLTSRVGGAPWHGLAHRTSKCLFVRFYFTGKDLYKSLHCHACNSWAQLFLLNADRRQGVRVTWTCDARSLEKMKPKYLVEEEFIFYSCGFSSVKPYLNFLSNTKFT